MKKFDNLVVDNIFVLMNTDLFTYDFFFYLNSLLNDRKSDNFQGNGFCVKQHSEAIYDNASSLHSAILINNKVDSLRSAK